MSDSEEQLSESQRVTGSNPQVNVITISDLPGKPFRITMEVPMFLVLLSVSVSSVAINNIVMYRTCLHALHHEDAVCQAFLTPDKFNVSRPLEIEVQKYMTFVMTVKTVLESIGPAILALFLGAWSDTYGRKPLVVWSLLGMIMASMMTVVYSTLNDFGPWWYILTAIPYAFTGGFTMLFTGAICFITDISNTENRSLRMTILEAVVSIGSVIGGISSSYLLKSVGNVYLLLISTILYVLAYAFTNVYIKESLSGAVQGGIQTVLDVLLVKEMFHECFKRRPNKGRAQILLLTFANCLSVFLLFGLGSLEYLYTREKLQWSMKEYTIFSASSTMISFAGSFIGVGLVQKMLPISDLAFAMVAFLSSAIQYFIRAFATLTWHMYFIYTTNIFFQGGIRTVLDFLLVKEMFRECFKRRPNKGRAQILLLVFANCLSLFILYGMISLEYLYAREKIQWSMKEYTIYSASSTMISFVGSFIGVGLVQKVLPVGDLAFAMIAFLSSTAQYFVQAFATLGWHMYFGAGISLFKGLSSPLIRSFISKILPVEDIAKVFALMGAIEGICPLFSPVIYNSIYNVSIVKFPGAIYILSGAITIGCTTMLGFVQYFRWRTPASPSYRPMEE